MRTKIKLRLHNNQYVYIWMWHVGVCVLITCVTICISYVCILSSNRCLRFFHLFRSQNFFSRFEEWLSTFNFVSAWCLLTSFVNVYNYFFCTQSLKKNVIYLKDLLLYERWRLNVFFSSFLAMYWLYPLLYVKIFQPKCNIVRHHYGMGIQLILQYIQPTSARTE